MIYYPLQSFGVGDAIFTQTLVRELANGNKILWGVEPHFVEGLNRAYPDILFVDKAAMNVDYGRRDEYEIHGMRVLPIRWADVILKLPYENCMAAKYLLYDKSWRLWRSQAMWTRDVFKEEVLYSAFNVSEPFTLVNRYFGSQSQYKANIPVEGVEMKSIPGFSLFDWARLIERADEIHTVSTSIIYLLELLEIKAKEVHLYTRKPIEPHFKNVDYLLTRHNYIFHND